jgi:maltose alpha-D-glucosyltransferase / alpha-amylase
VLNWTERIIRMRREVPEVGWGDFTVIPRRDPAVLIVRYDWRNNWVLFVHNLDAKPREVTFSVGLEKEHAEEGKLLVNLLGEEHSHADKKGKHRLVIEAYGYRCSASAGWTISFGAATSTSRQANRLRNLPDAMASH